ncbi:SDR family NAD(P)-dependent oxidoreductase [Streptomyces sp. M19]
MITGGTGALGGHVARWLAREGAEHLVLASRRGPDAPGAGELAAELGALGAEVSVVGCDTADRAALAALVARLDAEDRPVRSVFHTAGTAVSRPLADTGTAELADALAAKAAGAAHLDALLDGRELDAFVLFSSGAAVWGAAAWAPTGRRTRSSTGSPNAAAPGRTGPFRGLGHVGRRRDVRRRQAGPAATDRPAADRPERGVRVLADALSRGEATLTVADVDWARFATGFTAARPRPLLDDIPEAVRPPAGTAPDAGTAPAPGPNWPGGWPRCPRPSSTGSCWPWSAPRPPRPSASPRRRRSRPTGPSGPWASTH